MDIIVAVCGLALSVGSVCMLIRLMLLRKNGTLTEAEVVSADRTPSTKNVEYTHMLRFELGGRTVERRLKTSFTQPFAVGRKMDIYVDEKHPDFIKLAERMSYNMWIFTAAAVVGVLVAVRFALLAIR